MSKNECKLQLLDLYFPSFVFNQQRDNNDNEYNTSFNIEYAINSVDETKVKITIDTIVKNSSETLKLSLRTVGIFKIDKNDLDSETFDHLAKTNTVAILFPYIRSQVSLLTTQPGLMPVIIPPFNITALISDQSVQEQ